MITEVNGQINKNKILFRRGWILLGGGGRGGGEDKEREREGGGSGQQHKLSFMGVKLGSK